MECRCNGLLTTDSDDVHDVPEGARLQHLVLDSIEGVGELEVKQAGAEVKRWHRKNTVYKFAGESTRTAQTVR